MAISQSIGFAFPKDERDALVAAQSAKFFMPIPSDLRYNWVLVWLDTIDLTEMRELVVDAWRMVVPKRVAAECLVIIRERHSTAGRRCPR